MISPRLCNKAIPHRICPNSHDVQQTGLLPYSPEYGDKGPGKKRYRISHSALPCPSNSSNAPSPSFFAYFPPPFPPPSLLPLVSHLLRVYGGPFCKGTAGHAVISDSFWAVAWMVALIYWRLLGTMGLCMPRALQKTPRNMASDLKIPQHNLAHGWGAKFCHSKCRLFPLFPSRGTSEGCSTWVPDRAGKGCVQRQESKCNRKVPNKLPQNKCASPQRRRRIQLPNHLRRGRGIQREGQGCPSGQNPNPTGRQEARTSAEHEPASHRGVSWPKITSTTKGFLESHP